LTTCRASRSISSPYATSTTKALWPSSTGLAVPSLFDNRGVELQVIDSGSGVFKLNFVCMLRLPAGWKSPREGSYTSVSGKHEAGSDSRGDPEPLTLAGRGGGADGGAEAPMPTSAGVQALPPLPTIPAPAGSSPRHR
ncbi:unnamed protein product, partial [Phaeothamnion confervicola]